MEPKVNENPLLRPIDPSLELNTFFFQIIFNIILLLTSRHTKISLPFKLCDYKTVCIHHLTHAYYMSDPPHPPSFPIPIAIVGEYNNESHRCVSILSFKYFLCALLSNAFNLRVRGINAPPYKTRDQVSVPCLNILIFRFSKMKCNPNK